MQQIENLLTAVDSLQACLEDPDTTRANGRFEIFRTVLRSTAVEAKQVVEHQRDVQMKKLDSRKKVALATSLQRRAEYSACLLPPGRPVSARRHSSLGMASELC